MYFSIQFLYALNKIKMNIRAGFQDSVTSICGKGSMELEERKIWEKLYADNIILP